MLLLHGGPGGTHEYFEAFDSYLPAAGVEYYYYDQLGSAYSDQPNAPELWEVARFVEEVEQVRKALALEQSNFVLFGHSWGGILAIEYRQVHCEFFFEVLEVLVNDGAAGLPDRVADKENFHGERRNPTAGVWHHLFEPVHTDGLPIRALGDLGTRKRVRPAHHASVGLPNK